MASKRVAAIAVAVWLTWAAFVGLSANALPNHVVAGGVFNVGNDATPGGAADFAGMVFYSPNQPSYALLSGADSYIGADGTNPALFAKDVGASWPWADGDIFVAVVETTRGVNGWSNVNYTTSIDGYLRPGATTQDVGNTALQAFPTLTFTSGLDYVHLTWTSLADAYGDVRGYALYTGPTTATMTTQLTQVIPPAAMTFNNTGLAAGRHCYAVAVDYWREQANTTTYETVGRSEPICTSVTGLPPYIQSTAPANGASGMVLTQAVSVDFSEPIVPASFTYTFNPNPGGLVPTFTNGDRTATIAHNNFVNCTTYTITVLTARDLDNNALDNARNLVPNPWSFTTQCPSPFIVLTIPANGATQVRTTAPIHIEFNKAMNTGSVTIAIVPNLAGLTPQWTGNAVVDFTHATPFTANQQYSVTVSGQDTLGNALIAGPAANPFQFTVNTPPQITNFPVPGVSECHCGGSSMYVNFTMSDPEGFANLRYWLNYTVTGGGTSPIAGAQDRTPAALSESYLWANIPMLNNTITISLEVVDGAGQGEKAQDLSNVVTIDTRRPTATAVAPSAGATNVPTNVNIVITFSEAMQKTPTQNAFTIQPAVSGLSFAWSSDNLTLTVSHTTNFAPSQSYNISFGAGAVDACTPGNSFATFPAGATQSRFTTGTGTKRPNPPTGLGGTAATNSITLTWSAPTTYTDGATIPAGSLTYRVERATNPAGTWTIVGASVSGLTVTDNNLSPGTTYYYKVTAIDATYGESDASANYQIATTGGPSGEFPWLWVIIAIVVILVVVGLVLLLRRKPAAAPAAEKEAPEKGEAPKEEEAPGEGAEKTQGAKEEGGEKFIPCPNCGTMVKPTDAECFVCGAKL